MAPSSAPGPCPCCAAPLVEIRVGAELLLRSCSRCDSRWWLRGEEVTPIGEVLGAVRAIR